MPYKSEAQRRFMHVRHPGIAKRWDKKYSSKLPGRVKRRVKCDTMLGEFHKGLSGR